MVVQCDIAAVTRSGLPYTLVATFVVNSPTLLGTGVPIISAALATCHPIIFSRTVTDGVTMGVSGVGGTVFGTCPITWL